VFVKYSSLSPYYCNCESTSESLVSDCVVDKDAILITSHTGSGSALGASPTMKYCDSRSLVEDVQAVWGLRMALDANLAGGLADSCMGT
jgi:hypothetical protein